jgi:hypothetical protein
MATDQQIPYDHLWRYINTRKKNGGTDAAEHVTDVLRQIAGILPEMPLKDTAEILHACPDVLSLGLDKVPTIRQSDFWKIWCKGATIQSLSLSQLGKQSKNLLPSVLVIIWSTWLRRASLNLYTRDQMKVAAKRLPPIVTRELGVAWRLATDQLAPSLVALTEDEEFEHDKVSFLVGAVARADNASRESPYDNGHRASWEAGWDGAGILTGQLLINN